MKKSGLNSVWYEWLLSMNDVPTTLTYSTCIAFRYYSKNRILRLHLERKAVLLLGRGIVSSRTGNRAGNGSHLGIQLSDRMDGWISQI
jgi:hypothetical protein